MPRRKQTMMMVRLFFFFASTATSGSSARSYKYIRTGAGATSKRSIFVQARAALLEQQAPVVLFDRQRVVQLERRVAQPLFRQLLEPGAHLGQRLDEPREVVAREEEERRAARRPHRRHRRLV